MTAKSSVGSAVLIHGGWAWPDDWRWVREDLEAAVLTVVTPDLPSMRPETVGSAGFAEDVAEVRAAIEAAPGPVTVMGWSYGSWVLTGAVAGIPSVRRIIYLATPPDFDDDGLGWAERDEAAARADPSIHVDADGTYVLDNALMLSEPVQASLPPWMIGHFEQFPRRRETLPRYETVPLTPVWETIPTTIVLGRFDPGTSEAVIEKCRAQVPDTRVWETDHFPLFRMPHEVAAVVLEGFSAES